MYWVGALLLSSCMGLRPAQGHSVLLVIADDVGEEAWSLQPSLQALASQGTRFTRAYSYPLCAATRYALLFGRYQRRDGLGGNETNCIDPAAPRLPMGLRSVLDVAGLHSALIGKWHNGRADLDGLMDHWLGGPFAFGFDHWLAGSPTAISLGGGTGYRDWPRVDDGALETETIYATIAQRDALLEWWSSTSGPKFGVLSWSAAHAPWDRVPGFSSAQWAKFDDREKFERVVSYMDTQLGAVLKAVDLETTYVIWIGDNGTPNLARPPGSAFNHWKFTTWEGGVHVSLVVSGPGIEVGETDRLVHAVDVPATISELLGACTAFDDGLSFANELGDWDGTPARMFVFTERWDDIYDDQAIIEAEWKLRRVDPDGDGPLPSEDHFYVYPDAAPQLQNWAAMDRLRAELESLPPRK